MESYTTSDEAISYQQRIDEDEKVTRAYKESALADDRQLRYLNKFFDAFIESTVHHRDSKYIYVHVVTEAFHSYHDGPAPSRVILGAFLNRALNQDKYKHLGYPKVTVKAINGHVFVRLPRLTEIAFTEEELCTVLALREQGV